MIDTHCHVLPGIDDGPPGIRGSVDLARALAADGVSEVLATPHHSRRHPSPLPEVAAAAAALRDALSDAGVALAVHVAAEVAPARVLDMDDGDLRRRATPAGCLLVEAEPPLAAAALAAVCERVAAAGLRPVVAHPERCRALHRAPGALDALRRNGAWIQVVAPSLAGDEDRSVTQAAWRLVESGRADMVASDAHDDRRRPPRLAAAAALVERRLGLAARDALFRAAPRAMVGAPAGGVS